jgi:thiol-disulfide isomerase/thioredoxin
MNRQTIITFIVLLSILLVAGWYVFTAKDRTSQRQLQQSRAAQVFQSSSSTNIFSDFGGNAVDLNQYLGQLLVVNSWASWSPSSVGELQLLTTVAKEYADQGVVVIAINRAESQGTAEQFLALLGLDDSVQLIVDKDDQYYKAIGGYTMPETVFYNKKGDIILHKRGVVGETEIRTVIEAILQEK